MWLNSDSVSEVCTLFSALQNARSVLEAAEQSGAESLAFSGELYQVHTELGRP